LPPFSSALPVARQAGRRQGGAHPGPRLRRRLAPANRHLSETRTQVVCDALQKDGLNATIIQQQPLCQSTTTDTSAMDPASISSRTQDADHPGDGRDPLIRGPSP
jgi:hypothetical protein